MSLFSESYTVSYTYIYLRYLRALDGVKRREDPVRGMEYGIRDEVSIWALLYNTHVQRVVL